MRALSLRAIPPVLAAATLAWCLFVGWRLWTTPVRYVGVVFDAGAQRAVGAEKYERFADISALGPVPLVVPVVLTALGTIAALRSRTRVLFVLAFGLLAYSYVTGFSIGSAYMPAGGALLLAALIARFLRTRS